MKKTYHLRTLGVLVSALAALGLAACDSGGDSGGAGGGSGGGTSAGPAAQTSTSSGGPATSSSSTGGNLTLSMIDDMEDMDGSILASTGRSGAWYVYNDASATGMQTPPVDPKGMTPFPMTALSPPRGSSMYAAHTSGSGFSVWGAGFGFDLSNSGGMNPVKSPYDASKYSGVHFFAKSNGPLGIRINIGDGNTTPEGGKCVSGGMMPTCSDDFGMALNLTDAWQEFTIKFSDMTQAGWAMQKLPAIDAKTLYSVHFQVAQGLPFDIWVDDIAFFN